MSCVAYLTHMLSIFQIFQRHLICLCFVSLCLNDAICLDWSILPPDSRSKNVSLNSLAGVTVERVCCCFSFIRGFLFHLEDEQMQTERVNDGDDEVRIPWSVTF